MRHGRFEIGNQVLIIPMDGEILHLQVTWSLVVAIPFGVIVARSDGQSAVIKPATLHRIEKIVQNRIAPVRW